jgi:hypothetical protein
MYRCDGNEPFHLVNPGIVPNLKPLAGEHMMQKQPVKNFSGVGTPTINRGPGLPISK